MFARLAISESPHRGSRSGGRSADLLGTQVIDRDGALDLRLDRRTWRVRISEGEVDDLAYAGWEVADDAELDALVEKLSALGHAFVEAAASEAEGRQVRRLVTGSDPDGNPTEIFHSAAVAGDRFVSPHGNDFATDLGVGHMVLYCSDLARDAGVLLHGLGPTGHRHHRRRVRVHLLPPLQRTPPQPGAGGR